MDGLGQMGHSDRFRAAQISNGAGDLENPMITPHRKRAVLEELLQKLFAGPIQRTKMFEMFVGQSRVAKNTDIGKAFFLAPTRRKHTLSNHRRIFRNRFGKKSIGLHRQNFHMQIDPVDQRARNFVTITQHMARIADARPLRMPKISTSARMGKSVLWRITRPLSCFRATLLMRSASHMKSI